jgi:hypothetical protein
VRTESVPPRVCFTSKIKGKERNRERERERERKFLSTYIQYKRREKEKRNNVTLT